MNPDRLNKVRWIKYLEREQELFIFASFVDAYGKMFKEATGFGFEKQLHHYKDGRGIFYREEKEMKKCDNHFADLIDKKDKSIHCWIQKEKEIWKKRKLFTHFNTVRDLVKIFHEALLYNTVIPYRLMSALQHTKSTHKELHEKLEDIRSKSLYPILFAELIEPLIEDVSEKVHTSKEVASMITPQELIAISEDGLEMSEDELKKRNGGCYFYLSNGNIVFHYGDLYLGESRVENVEELKGSIACQGVVKGRVKIVNNPKQMTKFKKGDILLSINTNPSLMPVIEKASAIVTDEGGMLCHAAIISRELRIPCVIGTGFATKIFTDGDQIEVDAMKGIVKKIKS